jgi:hypothetical protein
MLYKYKASIPANTTSSAPNWVKFKVCKGTVKQWILFADPESADLLNFRVFYHGRQIMPFSSDEWITGFLSPVSIPENLELTTPPYELDIKAYNDDDLYAHEYFIHLVIIRDEAYNPENVTMGFLERFKGFLGGG